MRLVVRLLGLDLIDVELTTDSPSPEAGTTDFYMGFTNGREVE